MAQGEKSYFGKDTDSYKDSLCANGCNTRSIEGSVLCRKCFDAINKYNKKLKERTLDIVRARYS